MAELNKDRQATRSTKSFYGQKLMSPASRSRCVHVAAVSRVSVSASHGRCCAAPRCALPGHPLRPDWLTPCTCALADDEEELPPARKVFIHNVGGYLGANLSKAFAAIEGERFEVIGTLKPDGVKPRTVALIV